jgi:hypothetical protein
MNLKNKKTQVTIFIIIGLIIIVFIALLFVLIRNFSTNITSPENINGYVKNCLKVSLEKVNKELLDGNFYPNMSNNYYIYNNEKIKYLCKASEFYKPCVAQEPMLSEYLRQQILNATTKDTQKCFSTLVQNLKDKSYEVTEGNLSMDIEMFDEKIVATANKEITTKKRDDIRSFKVFTSIISSPLYKLAYHARSIVNFESTLCEFNQVGWMKQYYDIKVTKFVGSDETKAYTITDRKTGTHIAFAVKTCVLPAGI